MALLALLALLWQALAVQPHIHVAHPDASSAIDGAKAGSSHARPLHRTGKPSIDCPVCRQLAQAGRFLLPAAPLLLPAAAVADRIEPLLPLPWRDHPRFHGWRSRGPPSAS